MNSRSRLARTSTICVALLLWSQLLPVTLAQSEATEPPGFILGKVFEVDKEKYRDLLGKHGGDPAKLDSDDFLIPRARAVVTGRQIETNNQYDSTFSDDAGDYILRDTPPGVYEFTLQVDGEPYPVAQRLGVKVDLSFVAELCFVIDREEKTAWMVAAGPRRAPEVPPWVPTECMSEMGACLAAVLGENTLPDGLILLLAGSAAAATNIGIVTIEEREISSPKK